MWKAVLLLVALMVAGHFAVRYLRANPLAPVLEGGQLAVETREHVVRFTLEGPLEGTYLVAKVESQDFGDEPMNATVSGVGFATAREYLSAHPDVVGYGSASDFQLESLAAPLAVIAANRITYGELRGLIDRFEERTEDGGRWLCVTLSGDALGIASAESSISGGNATALYEARTADKRLVLARKLRVDDCESLL